MFIHLLYLAKILCELTPEETESTLRLLNSTLKEEISDAIKRGELMNAEGVPTFKSGAKKGSTG
ncbi:hypothetical protein THOM_0255 [Trachipleistophora hominis]|uniref:Uncharacterized protein n=1 Tax=Trachipleistophora hominis TaxID=72359 RepID=L7K072_TRAHO|nr:hypothetical protein THOM_0255 [Trachipleistophora hominis]